MKLVLLIVVILAIVWFIRRDKPAIKPDAQRPNNGEPLDMLACAQCGLHLPRNEALPGRGGVFCTEAHRSAFEKAHPAS